MKVKIFIAGPKVQDVGYRAFLLNMASELNIERFYAKNVKGGVQVLVEGDEASLNKLVEGVKSQRPPLAEVAEIKIERYVGEVPKRESFAMSFMAEQTSKMVQVGLSMLSKQDGMLGKMDVMLEKQDVMIDKQDQMLKKQDIMLDKMDLMLNKQGQMLEKQDIMLGKMDLMLGKQDAMIDKQDQIFKKQDTMVGKMDQMLEKQGETIDEIKGIREDLRSLFHREIESLRKEIDELKRVITKIEAKIGIV